MLVLSRRDGGVVQKGGGVVLYFQKTMYPRSEKTLEGFIYS